MTFRKVLIINIFGIGDVLFTTPLIAAIKEHSPQTQIGFVCNARAESILKTNPHINKIFIYERDAFSALYKKSVFAFWKELLRLVDAIKREEYDAVFDVSLNTQVSIFCWLAGIKQRIGFNYKNRSPWLTKKISLVGFEGQHIVDYYLSLLNEVGINTKARFLELYVSESDKIWADASLKQKGITFDKPIIGIVPGGGASWGQDASYKRWDAVSYAKLADKLIEKYSSQIILLGDKRENDLCRQMMERMQHKAISFCGETTLTQFGALARRSNLMVVNDGGPLHIAVAAGCKTVSIFGPVDENVYGPYPKEEHKVVSLNIACRPCYRRFRRAQCAHVSCLKNISVDQVYTSVEEILNIEQKAGKK